ncbi:CHAP domain-containing protein [Lacticaseibacillus mingshuiensis]|uniref:CHAP domain-containing protein n=1 Tax=Lacticaseibacillus mingshuiensis TaxID=2799574 RepID=UPI00194E3DED|nr:CHAP domain-containing protein [Lacticaseibacillus mingshuiensis]
MKAHQLLTGILAAGLILASAGAVGATPVSASASSDAQNAITANKSKTELLLDQISTANSKVIKLNNDITAKNKSIAATQDKIDDTTKTITKLVGQITEAKAEVKARDNVMKKQLKSLQKQAGDSVTGNVYVDFMLNSQSLSDLVSRSFTVNKLNQANKDAMDSVVSAKNKLAGLQKNQEDKKTSLVDSKDKLVSDKANLVSLQKEAKAEQSALNKKIKANRSTLVKLQATFAKAQAAEAAAYTKALEQAQAAARQARLAKLASTTVVTKKAATVTTSDTTTTTNQNNSSNGATHDAGDSGNSYAWGQCTWYVKSVAPWAGNMWGNGGQWGASAQAAGFDVDHTPEVGSIIVFLPGQSVGGHWTADPSYGHVAYVVGVSGNEVTIHQGGMGFPTPGGPNEDTIGNATSYTYIHH